MKSKHGDVKVSIYDALLHDEHIQKFIDKNVKLFFKSSRTLILKNSTIL